MNIIVMNSENSKMFQPYRLLFNSSNNINLEEMGKYAYFIKCYFNINKSLSIVVHYTCKNIKNSQVVTINLKYQLQR